jgi:sensor histidine kinase regulating citrate/malate metabolism
VRILSLSELLVCVLLFQAFLVLLAAKALHFYNLKINPSDLLVAIIAALNFIIIIIIAKWLLKLNIVDEELKKQKNTISLIRSERHDLFNHLSSIHGLILAGEHQEAGKYIQDIGASARFNSKLLNIDNIALRVLLKNKSDLAQSMGIDVQIKSESNVKELHLAPAEITSVFGNLIDNAIDAMNTLNPKNSRKIKLEINETDKNLCFFLTNTGPRISDEVIEKMFNEGFSLKGDNRGYGLSIVKKIIDKYNGQIFYDQELAGFYVIIPKCEDLL